MTSVELNLSKQVYSNLRFKNKVTGVLLFQILYGRLVVKHIPIGAVGLGSIPGPVKSDTTAMFPWSRVAQELNRKDGFFIPLVTRLGVIP